MEKLTQEEFIRISKIVHNDYYKYDSVNYINKKKPVFITCPKHGIFPQRPFHHLNGNGCPSCAGNSKDNIETFIKKSNKIHNNFYNYSLSKYFGSKIELNIICPKHGIFQQRPNNHLMGQGCPVCAGNIRKTLEKFIKDAVKVHGDRYSYKFFEYINANKKSQIDCPKHGIFQQSPLHHLNGQGCPICNYSKGEYEILKFLDRNKIKFYRQHKFDNCKYINKLQFDFYLPDLNICIEFDGKQHFDVIKKWGGLEEFIKRNKRDVIKTEYCNNNSIKLIRIKYDEDFLKKLDFLKN